MNHIENDLPINPIRDQEARIPCPKEQNMVMGNDSEGLKENHDPEHLPTQRQATITQSEESHHEEPLFFLRYQVIGLSIKI